ncbi:MAG: glutathione S-transferase [Betaproteobacteria bacterium]|nr:glutathione S-transferase [Betaproteobacteria bacterium]
MPQAAYPVLYSFRRCPYAMRARLALAASGQACELREVVLADKPQAMLAVSPKGTVPVLIEIDGRVLEESLDIMLWALRRHDPEHWLKPEQGSLAEMLDLIARFDDGFKYHLDRYKYPGRFTATDPSADYASTLAHRASTPAHRAPTPAHRASTPAHRASTPAHRAAGAAYLSDLETRLALSTWLFGGHATLADMSIAPFVRQFAHTDKTWFDAQPWPRLQAWLAAILDLEHYHRAMVRHPQWRPGEARILFP